MTFPVLRTLLIPLVLFSCMTQECNGLAVKKKGSKPTVASSQRGFGISPIQAFQEYCSSLTTRVPEDALTPCACGSQNSYQDCCQPFHLGNKYPETPGEILQTRYSAFSYRIVPYVIETTDQVCRDYRENKLTWAKDLHKSGMFDSYAFVRLEKLAEESGISDKEAFIEFRVHLQDKISGEPTIVTEKSRFVKGDDDKWRYASGDVSSEVPGLEGTKLN